MRVPGYSQLRTPSDKTPEIFSESTRDFFSDFIVSNNFDFFDIMEMLFCSSQGSHLGQRN